MSGDVGRCSMRPCRTTLHRQNSANVDWVGSSHFAAAPTVRTRYCFRYRRLCRTYEGVALFLQKVGAQRHCILVVSLFAGVRLITPCTAPALGERVGRDW